MKYRMSTALLVALVTMFTSGCILLEPHRLRDFTGPSWEVPISLPVIPYTRFDLSGFEFIANQDREIGFRYSAGPFAPPELTFSSSGQIELPPLTKESPEAFEVSLTGLADIPQLELLAGELSLSVENSVGVAGTLNLNITGLREGVESVSMTHVVPLTPSGSTVVDLSAVLNHVPRPDAVRVKYSLDVPAQTVHVESGDQVVVHGELWIPWYVHLHHERIAWDSNIAMEFQLSDDAKATLTDARLTDLAFVVDVTNHFPVGFEIELVFSNTSEALDAPSSVPISVPAGVIDSTGQVTSPTSLPVRIPVSEALREVLTGERVYVTPKFAITTDQLGPDGISVRFGLDDYLSVQGYAVVTLGINQQDDQSDTTDPS